MGSDVLKEAMDAAATEIKDARADIVRVDAAYDAAVLAAGVARSRLARAEAAFLIACREYAGLPPPEWSRDDE